MKKRENEQTGLKLRWNMLQSYALQYCPARIGDLDTAKDKEVLSGRILRCCAEGEWRK